MEWIADPTAWLGLLTLIVLELVLGIDNLVFIAILPSRTVVVLIQKVAIATINERLPLPLNGKSPALGWASFRAGLCTVEQARRVVLRAQCSPKIANRFVFFSAANVLPSLRARRPSTPE